MNKIEIRAKALELAIIKLNGTGGAFSFHSIKRAADEFTHDLSASIYEVSVGEKVKPTTTLPFIPLQDRIIVEEAPEIKQTKGGIIIPDTAEKEPKVNGIIVAMGSGFKDTGMIVQIGDNVMYSKYAGSDITIDGKTYKIIRETDIFGIILDAEANELTTNGLANVAVSTTDSNYTPCDGC
jgi:chaperonin GroES